MATQVAVPVAQPHSSAIPRVGSAAARPLLLLVAFVVATALAAAQIIVPPPVVPAGAPATAFSAERALAHLQSIARAPHTTGSPAQTEVRDYLLQEIRALGLTPVVQE